MKLNLSPRLYRHLLAVMCAAVAIGPAFVVEAREASGRINNYEPEREGSISIKDKSFKNFTQNTDETDYDDLIIYAQGGGAIFQQRFIRLKSEGYAVIANSIPKINEISNSEFIGFTFNNTKKGNEGEYDRDAVYGGAILNSCGDIGTITQSTFTSNSIINEVGAAYGGAIGHYDFHLDSTFDEDADYPNDLVVDDHESSIEHISAIFTSNRAIGTSGAYGGAIAANSVIVYNSSPHPALGSDPYVYGYNVIGTLAGVFSQNVAQADYGVAAGGAVSLSYTRANANDYQGIFSDFTNNSAINLGSGVANGGALSIYWSLVKNIQGTSWDSAATYSGNKAQATNGTANGGAIYIEAREPLGLTNLFASFDSNSAVGKNAAGGALMLYIEEGTFQVGTHLNVANLIANFNANSAAGVSTAKGGAVNFSTIDSYLALVVSLGGHNISVGVDLFRANFTGNSATASGLLSTAQGGAMYLLKFSSDENDEFSASFSDNTAKGYTAQGGALFVRDTGIAKISSTEGSNNLLFSGNKSEGVYASGGFLHMEDIVFKEEEVNSDGEITYETSAQRSSIRVIQGNSYGNEASASSYEIADAVSAGRALGGAIYINNCKIGSLQAVSHSTNRAVATGRGADAYGGFIYMDDGSTIETISSYNVNERTKVEYNFASSELGIAKGGAIYMESFETQIKQIEADFIANYVYGGTAVYGAAIALENGASIETLDESFLRNYAVGGRSYGGAVSIESAQVHSIGGRFESNYATSSLKEEGGLASGGAIYIHSNESYLQLDGVVFKDNYTSSSRDSYGGAIAAIKMSNSNGNSFSAEFDSNRASGVNMAYGGAFYYAGGGILESISEASTFRNNYAEGSDAQGGAIYLDGATTKITSLNASLFDANSARGTSMAYGGAISMHAGAAIGTIQTSFTDNYAEGAKASGGALYLTGNSTRVDYLYSTSIEFNSAKGTESGLGGAISVNQSTLIDTIGSHFKQNTALGNHAGGGAIYVQEASIKWLTGDFNANNAQGTASSYGGALANDGGIIQSLRGDILNNYSSATNLAAGGAISNTNGGSIERFSGNMTNNSARVSAEDGIAMGGALYNHNSEFTFYVQFADMVVKNNYIVNSEGVVENVAIYNHSTDGQLSTIHINTMRITEEGEDYSLTIWDEIDGSRDAVDKQIIAINYPSTASYSRGNVVIANEVSNQTINMYAGELHLTDHPSNSAYAGAHLTNSHLNIMVGGSVYAKGEDFGATSSFDNKGLLILAGGALQVQDASNSNQIYVYGDGGLGSFISGEGRIYVGSIGSPTPDSSTVNFKLSGEAFYRDTADGTREFSQQELYLQHDYHNSLLQADQLQLESSEMLSNIIGSDMRNILLSATITDAQGFEILGGPPADPFRWTVFTWETGEGLTEEQMSQLGNHITIQYNNRTPSGVQWYQTEYALTLTSQIVDVVDATYSLVLHEEGNAEHAFTISHINYDESNGASSSSRQHVQYKDVLGDDRNLTGSDAHYKGYNWERGNDGQILLKEVAISVDAQGKPSEQTDIFAYLLGKDRIVNPTGDVWFSFAGIEHDGAGGAILNDNNRIEKINSDFIANTITHHAAGTLSGGGAIANSSSGHITNIIGDFIANRIAPTTIAENSNGGALLNDGKVGSIKGDFVANAIFSQKNIDQYGVTSHSSHGGALSNYGEIGTIQSDFIGNYIYSIDSWSYGGALFNSGGTIESLIGNFYANSLTDGSALGGALRNANGGTIKLLKGDFIGNYIAQKTQAASPYSLIRGGAISNASSSLTIEDSSFLGNYIEAQSQAFGGAIANQESSLEMRAVAKNVYMTGNHTITHQADSTSLELSDGIYNTSTSFGENSVLNLSAHNGYHMVINDAISGATGVDINKHIINIRSDANQAQSYVAINNSISNQTLNLKEGTLRLGEYAGGSFTRDDGSIYQAQKSTAQLVNSTLTIEQDAALVIDGAVKMDDTSLIKKTGAQKSIISGNQFNSAASLSGGSIVVRSGTLDVVNLSLTQIDIITEAESTNALTISNCLIGSGVSFTGTSQIILSNSTLTELSMEARLTRSNEVSFNLTGLNIGIADLENGITLDAQLVDTSLFDAAYAASETIYIFVAGLELADTKGAYFNLVQGGNIYGLWNATQVGGDLRFTIGKQVVPEPSSATLSLLALTALLTRRRRNKCY